jgi:hypothetical protein
MLGAVAGVGPRRRPVQAGFPKVVCFADPLVVATGAIVILISVVFALSRMVG